MTGVRSLPLRARLCAGEDVESYARRLAARNFATVGDLENALKTDGAVANVGPKRGAVRLQLWRDLGALSPKAFTTPSEVAGYPVTVRKLCLLCTHGQVAFGRLPGVGMVCIRHRRWLYSPDQSLRHLEAALTAERRYRRHLAPRGVLFDAPIMQISLQAAVAGVPGTVIEDRRSSSGIHEVRALVYAEQVAIARLLSRPDVVGPATNPASTIEERHDCARAALDAALAHVPSARTWAAHREIDTALARMTELRRPYRAGREVGEEREYGILRFALLHQEGS